MSEASAAEVEHQPTALGSTEKLPISGNDDTPASSSASHHSLPPPKSPEETKSNRKCKCEHVSQDVHVLLRDIKTKTKELMNRAPVNGGLIHWTLQDAFITLNLIEGQMDGHIQEYLFFLFFFSDPDSFDLG